MIRNAIANRLAALGSVALSIAGFAAVDAGAQGTVTLSGTSGNTCAYSAITISQNGTLSVSCQGTEQPTSPPVCTVSGPASANANTSFSLSASCTPAATSYVWTGPGISGSGTTVSVSTAAGTHSYTVAGTNAAGSGAASAAHSVAVTAAPPPTSVPTGCVFATNPAAPQVNQDVSISLTCTQNPTTYAWAMYTSGMPQPSGLSGQTSSNTQVIRFSQTGTYHFAAQAGNALGGSDMIGAAVVVGAGTPPPPAGCSVPNGAVGPTAGYETLANLRFDLKPGQTGYYKFTLPQGGFNNARLSIVGATQAETPKTTVSEVTVAPCPGVFDVPASCKKTVYGTTGNSFWLGPESACVLPTNATYYVNIRDTTCVPTTSMGITYCSHYVKVTGG